jgi:deoxyribodipyrimidine photo-lyase
VKTSRTSIVWFRKDLRLEDNLALLAACEHGGPIIPLFIWENDDSEKWPMGAASKWWLHQSLVSLDKSLITLGSRLIICRGDFLETLQRVIRQTGATAAFWNKDYEPSFLMKEQIILRHLERLNITVKRYNASWILDPVKTKNRSGKAYQVFTPFWKACLAGTNPEEPVSAPTALPPPTHFPASIPIKKLKLEPEIDWAAGLRDSWNPGERGAHQQFDHFLKQGILHYERDRDRPDLSRSSRLSPHLHFGEISPRLIWKAVQDQTELKKDRTAFRSAQSFLRQLGWREFANHLLYHFPHTTTRPLREKFEKVPWKSNGTYLKSWQKGRTGYPIVDAGLRELWMTGWMHNRVRMIVASFLTKHLQISWQRGAEWFWDTLVDADLANNTLGWQWVAGCGADAAPYFRIFNPVTQGIKFDPNGEYVRKWVPELAGLPDPWLHKPWEAPPLLLKECGLTLGKTYPFPIVDHREARDRALQMFAGLKAETPQKSGSKARPVMS